MSDKDGTLSHTKLWANIGLFLISSTYVYQVLKFGLTSELMVTFGGIVVFGRVASKYLDGKAQSINIEGTKDKSIEPSKE